MPSPLRANVDSAPSTVADSLPNGQDTEADVGHLAQATDSGHALAAAAVDVATVAATEAGHDEAGNPLRLEEEPAVQRPTAKAKAKSKRASSAKSKAAPKAASKATAKAKAKATAKANMSSLMRFLSQNPAVAESMMEQALGQNNGAPENVPADNLDSAPAAGSQLAAVAADAAATEAGQPAHAEATPAGVVQDAVVNSGHDTPLQEAAGKTEHMVSEMDSLRQGPGFDNSMSAGIGRCGYCNVQTEFSKMKLTGKQNSKSFFSFT